MYVGASLSNRRTVANDVNDNAHFLNKHETHRALEITSLMY